MPPCGALSQESRPQGAGVTKTLHAIENCCKIFVLLHTFELLEEEEVAMAYNETLAQRVREALSAQPKVEEKKMMGGLTLMVNGKMCAGIVRDDLMARIAPEAYETALTKKGCREMDFTGKPMKGFVFISPEGTRLKEDLDYWIGLALDFNKRAKASKKRKKRQND
ncbi:MAG: TfoX/Sxy family protein [bacterium]